MAEYPSQHKFHAHRVVRQLFKTCAAMEIGQVASMLVVFVAHTEDAKRYSAAPNFFNDQLLPVLGIRKWKTLDNARKAAVDGGWLHYEEPPKGSRKPGVYWTTIPARFESIDDAPICELPPSRVMPQADTVGDTVGDTVADTVADTVGGNFLPLFQNPIPSPKQAPPDGGGNGQGKLNGMTPELFFSKWQKVAGRKNLKVERLLTTKRRKYIRTRLGEDGWLDMFREGLDHLPIPNDPPKFVWQPDLDWLIRNGENVVMLVEDKYDKGSITGPIESEGVYADGPTRK